MSVVFVSALLFDKNVLKIFKEDMLDLFTDNITMFGSFLLQQFSFLSEYIWTSSIGANTKASHLFGPQTKPAHGSFEQL